MDTKIQQLKDRFTQNINTLKEKVNEVYETANAREKNIKSLVEKKEVEIKETFNNALEKAAIKKQAVKESVEIFNKNRTAKHAERRAERSKDYALACIKLAQEAVIEAESAILEAIDTALEADLLKMNLK